MEKSMKLGSNYNPLEIVAPAPGDVLFCADGLVPYLRLKVTSSSRCWVFDKSFSGKHLKRRLGDAARMGLTEARLEAYKLASALEAGLVPETVKERSAKLLKSTATVGMLFMEYHEKHLSMHATTAPEIMRGFEMYWGGDAKRPGIPSIKKERVCDLNSELVSNWMIEIAKVSGNATANKQLTQLKACIRFAAGRGKCEFNPGLFLAVKRLPEDAISETLKKEQLAILEEVLKGYSAEIRDAIMMCLWTSQRKRNVLSMKWADIDFQSKTWTIPAAITKGRKKEYNVALTSKSLEILMRRRGNESPFVFPSPASTSGHIENINKAWLEIRQKADLGKLKIHGLRHTGATWLAEAGANAFEIQRRLQHSSVKTSERYVGKYASNTEIIEKSQEA